MQKYGIPLSRYTVFLQNCPSGDDPKRLGFCFGAPYRDGAKRLSPSVRVSHHFVSIHSPRVARTLQTSPQEKQLSNVFPLLSRALFRFAKQMTAHRRQGICDTVSFAELLKSAPARQIVKPRPSRCPFALETIFRGCLA